MKKFDIELAKAGVPVCTRDGHKARIVCFDYKNDKYPLIVLISKHDGEWLSPYTANGMFDRHEESKLDLFMAPATHTGYVAIYRDAEGNTVVGSQVYESEEIAKMKGGLQSPYRSEPVGYSKIEWEE